MKLLTTLLALTFASLIHAQKKSFDIVSFTPPAGWKEEITDSYISWSKITGKTWGQIAIYKSTASKGAPETDLENEWKALVLALHAMDKEETSPSYVSNGWTTLGKTGSWTFQKADVASVLTVYTNGTKCISLLCNATGEAFIADFLQMLKSVELPDVKPVAPTTDTAKGPVATGSVSGQPLVGLWGNYDSESAGFMNGMNMTTGGYFRKEYELFADGTYIYRAKDWSVPVKEIRFVYETGKYTIAGSQITFTPSSTKGEWWSKAADGRTAGWGKLVRSFNPKSEKLTYNFEVKYLSGMERNYLYLRSPKATERDGSKGTTSQHEFSYGNRDRSEASLIDTPPGTKTGDKGR